MTDTQHVAGKYKHGIYKNPSLSDASTWTVYHRAGASSVKSPVSRPWLRDWKGGFPASTETECFSVLCVGSDIRTSKWHMKGG